MVTLLHFRLSDIETLYLKKKRKSKKIKKMFFVVISPKKVH